jgi:hypothetical protein
VGCMALLSAYVVVVAVASASFKRMPELWRAALALMGIALFAALVAANFIAARREGRRRARLRAGCCPECGYDLRAARERCPECGSPAPEELRHAPPDWPLVLPEREGDLDANVWRAIEMARETARQLGDDYLSTEHLLMALVAELDGCAGRVLREAGFDAEDMLDVMAEQHRNAQGRCRQARFGSPPPSPALRRVVTATLSGRSPGCTGRLLLALLEETDSDSAAWLGEADRRRLREEIQKSL